MVIVFLFFYAHIKKAPRRNSPTRCLKRVCCYLFSPNKVYKVHV